MIYNNNNNACISPEIKSKRTAYYNEKIEIKWQENEDSQKEIFRNNSNNKNIKHILKGKDVESATF